MTEPMKDYPADLIHQRLLVGLGNNARGSLTRCASKLGSPEEAEEMAWTEMECEKLLLMLARQDKEREALEQSIQAMEPSIAEAKASVKELRAEWQQAGRIRACQQEYDTLAKVALQRHGTPRRVLLENLETVSRGTEEATARLSEVQGHVRVRKAQVQHVLQAIGDLKQSLAEPLVLEEGEEMEEQEGTEPEPMDEDPAPQEEGEEEEGLYGDL